jgi:phenylalanine-4-hydroxylase
MLEQQYGAYTPVDHSVWSTLYKRQIDIIQKVAYGQFQKSLDNLGFVVDEIPDFIVLNNKLESLTGWKIYGVPGLIPARQFFKLMVLKRFGATTWIRKMDQLEYLEEPDMFHDIFGHVPLLADIQICAYLHRMAMIAERYLDNLAVIEQISRLYWFTIEFGLVKESGQIKIYGAGILSSPGETKYVLSEETVLVPFNIEQVLETAYQIDRFQKQYFVLDDMGQLKTILDNLDFWLGNKYH